MKKTLIYSVCYFILFSCTSNSHKYEKNLDHYKDLVKDINAYFVDSTKDIFTISNYYTENFIFH